MVDGIKVGQHTQQPEDGAQNQPESFALCANPQLSPVVAPHKNQGDKKHHRIAKESLLHGRQVSGQANKQIHQGEPQPGQQHQPDGQRDILFFGIQDWGRVDFFILPPGKGQYDYSIPKPSHCKKYKKHIPKQNKKIPVCRTEIFFYSIDCNIKCNSPKS